MPSAMATPSPRLAAAPRTISNRFLSGTVISGYGLRYGIGSGIIVLGRGNEHGSNGFECPNRRRGPPWGPGVRPVDVPLRSEEHTSELQSQSKLVCRLLLE